MRGFLLLCVCLPLAGCLAGAAHGRSTATAVYDDGVHPVKRTTYTSEQSGSYIGGMPMMPGGYGYGYGFGHGGGYVTVAGSSCVLHPDNCAVISTQTIVQPVTVVSNGGGANGSGGGDVEPARDPELDAFLAKHEKAIAYLAGQHRQSVRQTCQVIIANPEVIKDPAERKEIVDTCEAYLAKHPYQPSQQPKKEEE